jgi:hypothetical protein
MTAPNPLTTTPAKPSSLMRVARIIWIFVGVIVAMIVLGAVMGSKKDEGVAGAPAKTPTSAPGAATPPPVNTTPPLATNVAGFEAAIPLLKQVGHVVGKDNLGNTTYGWSKISVTGMANSLILRDADHNAVPESGALILAVEGGKNDTALEAGILALKVVMVASGEAINAKTFAEWFSSVFGNQKVPPRSFGSVSVSLKRTALGTNSIIFVGLNQ